MRVLTASLFLALLLTGCSTWHEARARAEGRAEARRDIADGVLKVRTWGLPAPWDSTFEDLVTERLGVQVTAVAGCLIESDVHARSSAYNEVSMAEIKRRFGNDIFKTLEQEAGRIWHEQQASSAGKVGASPPH